MGRSSSEKDMAIGAVKIPTTFSRLVGVLSTGTWASAKNFLKTSWRLGAKATQLLAKSKRAEGTSPNIIGKGR